MHHCVYQCRYFLKKDVLIFSIRDDNGDRLATLEYNVKSRSIEQCRAVCNNVPARYDDMVATFNANTWRLTPSKQKGSTQKKSVKSPKKKQPLLNVA